MGCRVQILRLRGFKESLSLSVCVCVWVVFLGFSSGVVYVC